MSSSSVLERSYLVKDFFGFDLKPLIQADQLSRSECDRETWSPDVSIDYEEPNVPYEPLNNEILCWQFSFPLFFFCMIVGVF